MKSVGLLYIFVVGYFSYPPLKDDITANRYFLNVSNGNTRKNLKYVQS